MTLRSATSFIRFGVLLWTSVLLALLLVDTGRPAGALHPASADERELRFGFPDEFLRMQHWIRTRSGEVTPDYAAGYRVNEWRRAQVAAKGSGEPLPWVERGPTGVGGRTRSIIVDIADPTHDSWFAGSAGGGIWGTHDAGQSWVALTEDLPTLAVTSIAQSESNPDILYAGTGEGLFNLDSVIGGGILKSTDHGSTWSVLFSTMDSPDFQFVNRVIVSPDDPLLVVAATRSGLYRSTDGGAQFVQVLEAGTDIGFTQVIATPGDFRVQFAAESGRGVFKSIDDGQTWFPASHGIQSLADGGVSAGARIEVGVSPVRPSRLWALVESTRETDGVYLSDDAATTWQPIYPNSGTNDPDIGQEQGWYDLTVTPHPFDPDVAFLGGVRIWKAHLEGEGAYSGLGSIDEVATGTFLDFLDFGAAHLRGGLRLGTEEDEALVSEDQMVSVEIRFGPGRSQKAHRFVPQDVAKVDLADYPYRDYVNVPFEVWDLTNDHQLAVSFRDREDNGEFDLDHHNPADLDREYVFVHARAYDAEQPDSDIAKDGGVVHDLIYFFWPILADDTSWTPESLVESTLRFTYLRGTAPLRSTVSLHAGLHVDHHVYTPVIRSSTSFDLIAGTDGGIYVSTNEGASWTDRNRGYNTTQFYGIARKPETARYAGGMQDNGTWQSHDDPDRTSLWNAQFNGDGFDVLWHASDSDLMLGSTQYNGIKRSENSGATWTNAVTGLTDSGEGSRAPFVSELEADWSRPDHVFTIGGSGVWQTFDFGQTWRLTPISEQDWGFSNLGTVRMSLANANIVWAGFEMDAGTPSEGKLHVSTNGGAGFSAVAAPTDLSPGRISGIATHPTDSKTVFVLFSAAHAPKILRSLDLGQTWEDLSGFGPAGTMSTNGFPDVTVQDLLVIPHDPAQLWAATEIGLFISRDDGASWSYADNGLPAVSLWRLRIQDDEIQVATHGRGLWTVPLSAVPVASEYITTDVPENVALRPPYPNPVSGESRISFSLPAPGPVTLRIFDLTGRQAAIITTGVRAAGHHVVSWNASGLVAGVYFVRLETQTGVRVQPIIVVH